MGLAATIAAYVAALHAFRYTGSPELGVISLYLGPRRRGTAVSAWHGPHTTTTTATAAAHVCVEDGVFEPGRVAEVLEQERVEGSPELHVQRIHRLEERVSRVLRREVAPGAGRREVMAGVVRGEGSGDVA